MVSASEVEAENAMASKTIALTFIFPLLNELVVRFLKTYPLAARDFSARRGASDEHISQWICKERATKSGRKRTAARRVAPNLACGRVARRLQIHFGICALLAPCHRPNWAQRTSSYLCS